jgi:hypothetical protein
MRASKRPGVISHIAGYVSTRRKHAAPPFFQSFLFTRAKCPKLQLSRFQAIGTLATQK